VVQGTMWRKVLHGAWLAFFPYIFFYASCKNGPQIYIKKQLKQIKRKKNKKILKYICVLNIYILYLHQQREKNAV
jgi:hypothetical protein